MDETVVGAAPARWTTAGMKREDGMQGSRSEAVDERGRSLVMDGGVGVSAPTWWRRTTVHGVADGGGGRRRWTEEGGVERVFWRPRSTNGEKGGREEGGTMYSGRACLKCEEIYKLTPRFKFLLHHSNISLLGIGR